MSSDDLKERISNLMDKKTYVTPEGTMIFYDERKTNGPFRVRYAPDGSDSSLESWDLLLRAAVAPEWYDDASEENPIKCIALSPEDGTVRVGELVSTANGVSHPWGVRAPGRRRVTYWPRVIPYDPKLTLGEIDERYFNE